MGFRVQIELPESTYVGASDVFGREPAGEASAVSACPSSAPLQAALQRRAVFLVFRV